MTTEAQIRRDVPIPYYYQLIQVLQDAIERGVWPADTLIPSEHELCATYGVSRTVVRQALGELADHGVLYRVKGRGTFVAPRKVEEHFVQRTHGFYFDMTSRGHTVETRVIGREIVLPPPRVRDQLQLDDQEHTITFKRVRSVDGAVLLYVQSYLPLQLCPALADVDLSNGSLYEELQELCGLTVATGTRFVEAIPARAPITTLLNVGRGTPLLKIESVSFLSDGRPLEYYEAWHRGDRTKIEIEIMPNEGASAALIFPHR
ncbi:MAG TPA: GntR family transcriptional regulator [Chloroflexota bacterium]